MTPERRAQLRERVTVAESTPATQYTAGEWKRSWVKTVTELLDACERIDGRNETLARLLDTAEQRVEEAIRETRQIESLRDEEFERRIRSENLVLFLQSAIEEAMNQAQEEDIYRYRGTDDRRTFYLTLFEAAKLTPAAALARREAQDRVIEAARKEHYHRNSVGYILKTCPVCVALLELDGEADAL